MSQIARYSRSYPMLITIVVLLACLSLETSLCQVPDNNDNNTTEWKKVLPPNEYDSGEIPLEIENTDNPSNIRFITTRDSFQLSSFSNFPEMGLFSNLSTSLLPAENGWERSRRFSVFSYGSELMELSEFSWMKSQDELSWLSEGKLGEVYYENGFNRSVSLKDASFPFVAIREDLVKLSDALTLESDTTNTYYILFDDPLLDYNIAAINKAFGNSSQFKTFKYNPNYDPEMANLTRTSGLNLNLFLDDDIWAQFGSIFNNEDIMKLFHDAAVEKQNANNQPNTERRMPHWYEESEGGVYCRWGATP